MLDLVTSPPEDDPYTTLKEMLLCSHMLTDYQRIEQLLPLDGLGSKKPSELLAHMLELCPASEEMSKFFAFHFLHRLLQELCIMLGDDDSCYVGIQPLPVALARNSAGLCFYHRQFGNRAHSCEAPCSWQGN